MAVTPRNLRATVSQLAAFSVPRSSRTVGQDVKSLSHVPKVSEGLESTASEGIAIRSNRSFKSIIPVLEYSINKFEFLHSPLFSLYCLLANFMFWWNGEVMLLNVLNTPLSRRFSISVLRAAQRTMCEMAKVFVRSVENEERLQITFRYHPDNQQPLAQQRVFNFDRLKREDLERTMTHITTKINKVVLKRLRRKNKTLDVDVTPADVRVFLSEDGSEISPSEPNVSAWIEGRCMQIEDQQFHVCVNVPAVRKLSLPQLLMVGFPVYANINLEFADVSDCEFTWYRMNDGETVASHEESEESGSVSNNDAEGQESDVTKNCKKTKKSAVKIFVGRVYIPTQEDVGCQLKLECLPIRGEDIGEMVSMVSSVAVQSGPIISCPFEKRHKFTEQLTSGDRSVLPI